MRNTVYSRGNLLFRQCSASLDSQPQYMQPDAVINLTVIELRAMTRYNLADRLAPIAQKWWDKPWQARDVMAWESALATAIATDELSERSKVMLRHILSIVADWLIEYDAYEQACVEDERETMLNLGVAR